MSQIVKEKKREQENVRYEEKIAFQSKRVEHMRPISLVRGACKGLCKILAQRQINNANHNCFLAASIQQ